MKLVLALFGLTGLSHLMVLTQWPEWAGEHPAIAILEFGVWALLAWQWNQYQQKQSHQSGGKVVDLNQYRKHKEQQKKQPQWVCVFRGQDQAEMGLLTSLMEANEIVFQVAGRHSSSMLPNIGAVPMELMVRADQVSLAEKLLNDYSNLPPN